MKIIYRKLFGMALLLAVMTACEKPEGAFFSGEPNKVSFFSNSLNVVMGDGTIDVPIGRTSTVGELTIPVTLEADGEGYTDVFKISGPVTFASGEGKTYVNIQPGDLASVAPSVFSVTPDGLDVNAGLAFPITLNMPKEHGSPSEVLSVNVLAQSLLDFTPIGKGELDSSEGWFGENLTPDIHKADGVNVYKVVQPFGQNHNSFVFMINPDETIDYPAQVIYMHGDYGPVTMRVSSAKVDGDWIVFEVSGYTVELDEGRATFGTGIERLKLPN